MPNNMLENIAKTTYFSAYTQAEVKTSKGRGYRHTAEDTFTLVT